jgi:tripartite-type tricarboxylate transporter receptor subunit TctC
VLNSNVKYNTDSFVPVTIVGTTPLILFISPQIPAKNFKELIEYIKNNPKKTSWASPGIGSSLHLLGELMNLQYNLDMTHIVYKTMSQAMIDVSEDRVTLMFDVYSSKIAGLVDAGKLKPIMVTDRKSIAAMPKLETAAAYPQMITHVWFGLMAPAGIPDSTLLQLRSVMKDVTSDAGFKNRLSNLGIESSGIDDTNAQKYINNERIRWTNIIKQANIKVE